MMTSMGGELARGTVKFVVPHCNLNSFRTASVASKSHRHNAIVHHSSSRAQRLVARGSLLGVTRCQSVASEAWLAVASNSAKEHGTSGSRAVIVGGGLAGLASASVLSGLFDEVILLERDSISTQQDGNQKRGGVPQFAQPHVMLVGGMQHCEELFPRFQERLLAGGGQAVDWLRDCLVYDFGGYMGTLPEGARSPIESVGATRKLMEEVARESVAALPNVSVRSGSWVSGLELAETGIAIEGVRLKSGETIKTDFVVDASGRGSQLPQWLEGVGIAPPAAQTISAGLGYGSRTYAMPNNWFQQKGWKAAMTSPRPASGRQGMLLPVEGEKWQLILTGLAGDHPPTDEEGYLEFARSLPSPEIYQALTQAKPLGPIHVFNRTENVKRSYGQVDLPQGLCVVGDAATCFNPIYGQGMTVGIKGAILLRDTLQRRLQGRKFSSQAATSVLSGFSREYQTELSKLQEFPWTVATGDDEKHLRALGKLPPKEPSRAEAFINWYFMQATRLGMKDAQVRTGLAVVNHMVEPPAALFKPLIAFKVLLLGLQDAFDKLRSGLQSRDVQRA